MEHQIRFPHLGIVLKNVGDGINIGGFEIKYYGMIIAAGFLGSEAYVTEAFGVKVNQRTNVETKPDSFATNVENVFTAGDMHRGQSLVVWAIREGRDAAREVDKQLMGYTNL